jgi:hypothetical protein
MRAAIKQRHFMTPRQRGLNQMPAYKTCPTNNQQLQSFYGKLAIRTTMPLQAEPLIHIPLYCWRNAPDYAMRGMVQQLLACVQSYCAHENTYALLVTTNDPRPFEIVSAYKNKTGYGFQLQLVTKEELLSTFNTDLYRLYDVRSIRMICSSTIQPGPRARRSSTFTV